MQEKQVGYRELYRQRLSPEGSFTNRWYVGADCMGNIAMVYVALEGAVGAREFRVVKLTRSERGAIEHATEIAAKCKAANNTVLVEEMRGFLLLDGEFDRVVPGPQ
ncbi:MAG: hypothetical protein ACRCZI_11100 [Cetobacterium sp.]